MNNRRGAVESGTRAERLRIKPWTDPRLLIGVLLVLAATVVGARLVAMGDDTTDYWRIAADVRAGDPLTADDLVAAHVRLDRDSTTVYLRVDGELPGPMADLQWDRDLPAGSLLDVSALTRRGQVDVRQLPLTVTEGAAPTDLRRGDQVEIWVGPGPTDDDVQRASVRVLGPVRVLRTGSDAGSLGGALAQTVLVEVPATALTGSVVSTVGSGRVTIVRTP